MEKSSYTKTIISLLVVIALIVVIALVNREDRMMRSNDQGTEQITGSTVEESSEVFEALNAELSADGSATVSPDAETEAALQELEAELSGM